MNRRSCGAVAVALHRALLALARPGGPARAFGAWARDVLGRRRRPMRPSPCAGGGAVRRDAGAAAVLARRRRRGGCGAATARRPRWRAGAWVVGPLRPAARRSALGSIAATAGRAAPRRGGRGAGRAPPVAGLAIRHGSRGTSRGSAPAGRVEASRDDSVGSSAEIGSAGAPREGRAHVRACWRSPGQAPVGGMIPPVAERLAGDHQEVARGAVQDVGTVRRRRRRCPRCARRTGRRGRCPARC